MREHGARPAPLETLASLAKRAPHAPLVGETVIVDPLSEEHVADLEAAYTPALSFLFPRPFASARAYVDALVREGAFGPARLFALVARGSGKAVGCTGFFAIDPTHRKLEIGGTWIGKAAQGTAVNAESKLLLLRHAFGPLGCLRVEFKTDHLNAVSQAAMEKLGFTREGVLRNHLLLPDGRRRHSVYYSVIEEEWPGVEAIIAARVAAKRERG